ncbi:MAG: DUF4375 domain-containing protein [Cryobacterium sp.]
MRSVWDFHFEVADGERDRLMPMERQVLAICDLRQEVQSGGFDSYFRYWGGDTAPLAQNAIGHLLGWPWANLLAEAMSIFGEVYPLDCDLRTEQLKVLDADATLDEFDTRLNDLEAQQDSDALLTAALNTARTRPRPGKSFATRRSTSFPS